MMGLALGLCLVLLPVGIAIMVMAFRDDCVELSEDESQIVRRMLDKGER
ncbi:MAG: hypothetical protein Q9N62_01580 [Ghiorsea sp.]|nr:hypothetical protein [Ghiorsea sp.]